MNTKNKRKIYAVVFIVIACVYALLLANVVLEQHNYTPVKSDCIIILGHSVNLDNEPSSWLVARLKEGARLYDDGYAQKIIVSGGKGPSDNEVVAVVMRKWLVLNGVSAEDILIEGKAENTYENLSFSREIMFENQYKSAIIVTNDFHMYRSMLLGKRLIGDVSGSAATVPLNGYKLLNYLKEPFSIIKYSNRRL